MRYPIAPALSHLGTVVDSWCWALLGPHGRPVGMAEQRTRARRAAPAAAAAAGEEPRSKAR